MVEGAPHMAWNNQLVCPRVPLAPVYKGARGEAGWPLQGAPGGGVLLVGLGKEGFLFPWRATRAGRPTPLLLYLRGKGAP